MMKTSYSTIFNEGLDFSTVLLDREGNLIAEKNFTPSMMGAILHTVGWTLEELGEEFFEPGDVVVHNDPYRGNCHIPEHMLMKPIFLEGELLGFAGNHRPPGRDRRQGARELRRRRHRRLPGGPAAPAGQAHRGRRVQRAASGAIMLANHRTPRNTWGDFHAMIGALNVGERRAAGAVRALRARRPSRAAPRRLIDYSERRMRAEIADLPDGRYAAEMMVEDDGVVPTRSRSGSRSWSAATR